MHTSVTIFHIKHLTASYLLPKFCKSEPIVWISSGLLVPTDINVSFTATGVLSPTSDFQIPYKNNCYLITYVYFRSIASCNEPIFLYRLHTVNSFHKREKEKINGKDRKFK